MRWQMWQQGPLTWLNWWHVIWCKGFSFPTRMLTATLKRSSLGTNSNDCLWDLVNCVHSTLVEYEWLEQLLLGKQARCHFGAISCGLCFLVAAIIAYPLTYIGAQCYMDQQNSTGIKGLMITAWVFYGIMIVSGISIFLLGVMGWAIGVLGWVIF